MCVANLQLVLDNLWPNADQENGIGFSSLAVILQPLSHSISETLGLDHLPVAQHFPTPKLPSFKFRVHYYLFRHTALHPLPPTGKRKRKPNFPYRIIIGGGQANRLACVPPFLQLLQRQLLTHLFNCHVMQSNMRRQVSCPVKHLSCFS